MANKAPIFPLSEPPQQYSDYGFDPQFDYDQLMEEARRHKHKHDVAARSIDAAPKFKLQKPTAKAETSKNRNAAATSYGRDNSPAKKSWWKKALLLFRFKRRTAADRAAAAGHHDINAAYRGSLSGPVYVTQSRSGSSTPYRTRSRPSSGPLAGTASAPARRGELEIPYLSLAELNMDDDGPHSIPASPPPFYLVN